MAKSNLEEIRDTEVVVFTDGSCWPNPGGSGGWGFVAVHGKFEKEGHGGITTTTTNVAELTAVREALKMTRITNLPITVVTDSQYVRNVFQKWAGIWAKRGWVTSDGGIVANRKLIEEILVLIKENVSVRFLWMRGHQTGTDAWVGFNNRADHLASMGRKSVDKSDTLAKVIGVVLLGLLAHWGGGSNIQKLSPLSCLGVDYVDNVSV